MTRATGDKRQQILAAATEIFATRGFYQAKIADIAAAAGVGKGTVYEYFRSKKDLFQQLLLHLFNAHLDHLLKVVQEPDLAGFLERLFRESLSYFQAHQEIARILLSDHPPIDAATQRLLFAAKQEKLQRMAAYLKAAAERGEMRPVSPWMAANLIVGFIAALGHQLFFDSDMDFDPAAIASEAAAMILQGIGG
ncbi:Tetracycline transcriptional regulator,TetR-related, C-terminal [Moorella glycerini]|uniref:Fatty acid metabolism regulator protein n=1 Tax=Neomoorella stamsii TaxID=1266720 RepID=A0A9X7J1F0_9FIRM|nr:MULTISPECIES: TetR/AcrR family transcriptional regulator [Moorella]PRR69999.1 Fatty acid metabolism regulator protein [Moorella stamsii]CEP68450.1 Tetracycline transcriptional regulator,TetR-related, C-terminal [Moorella glycerini]